MPETKQTKKLLGFDVKVSDVPIKSASESFAEYELEDGSKIRVKFVRVLFYALVVSTGQTVSPFTSCSVLRLQML